MNCKNCGAELTKTNECDKCGHTTDKNDFFIEKLFKFKFISINILVISYLLYKIILNQNTSMEEYIGIIILWIVGLIPSAFMNYIINYKNHKQ